MKRLMIAATLGLALSAGSAHAAIEIEEGQNFGPTYGSAVADVTIGKPLQLAGAVIGTALHVINLPFASVSGSVDESYDTLVRGPWTALRRCTGCTTSYDAKIKAEGNQNVTRIIIDQPAEIVIHSSDTVNVH